MEVRDRVKTEKIVHIYETGNRRRYDGTPAIKQQAQAL
jgi:hypothetical protein